VYLLWRYSHQVLTTGERRRLESNYNSAKGVFLTLTLSYFARVAVGHLWNDSGTNFTGSISANTLRYYSSTRMIKTFKSPAFGLTPTAPFWGALYTYWLPAWVELLGFMVGLQTRPTKREACVQHEQKRLQEWVLKRHGRSHCKPASLCPVFSSINIGSFPW
jgi:hypothetical protein